MTMWEILNVETTRGHFEVFRKGKGKPIAVTHLYSEFNSKGNQFAESFTKENNVFLINLTDCGNSRKMTKLDDYSMASSVEDLEAIRHALGIKKWAYAGHSTGGMIGLKYAIDAPESLSRIIVGGLSASAAFVRHKDSIYCKDNPYFTRIQKIFADLASPETSIEERQSLNKEWTMMSLHNKQAYELMMERPNSGRTHSERLNYFSFTECLTYDLRPELPKIMTPTFIYAGSYDAQCPHIFGVEAANLIPNSKFETFENSNHFPYLEEELKFQQFVQQYVEV